MTSNEPAFELSETVVHIEDTGAMVPMAATEEFWKAAHAGERLYDRLLFVFHAETGDDLHSDVWERHPGADEFICVLSGAVDIIVEGVAGERRESLTPGRGFVVPRGQWHRLILLQPSDLLFINSRTGMELRAVESAA